MKVTLLAHTDLAEEIIASAGKMCYSVKSPSECMNHFLANPSKIADQMSIIHGSCFEHCSFSFGIDGISRVTSHQLVRHRIASYSQQSQRYVDVHKTWDNLVIPPKIQEIIDEEIALGMTYADSDMLHALQNFKDGLAELIGEMDRHRISSEDIRYLIPQGTKTNIIVTMNARELAHFLSLRMCKRAQWEIREMAEKMCEIIKTEFPLIADALHLGASCDQLGVCTEHRSCGKCKTLAQIKERV